MRNKDLEKFLKTGSIEDYLNYKKNKKLNGDENDSKGRNSSQNDTIPR